MRPVQIGKDTLIPLGMVAGLLLAVVGCYSWARSARFLDGINQNNNSRFSEIRDRPAQSGESAAGSRAQATSPLGQPRYEGLDA